jgi:putative ABC transport system substrate-binding protein
MWRSDRPLRGRAALVAAALAFAPVATAQAPRVVVVTTGDAAPYEAAIDGVKLALPTHAIDVRLLAPATRDALAAALAKLPRDVPVIALGTRAAEFVGTAAPGATGASCLVLGETRGGPEPRVRLDVPAEAQAAAIRRVLPDARTVGLLHDPAHNARRVAELVVALERAGLRTLVEPVAAPADLPRALERLGNAADVLLALPDPTVYARESARGLLTFSFRRRIPIAAYSASWVRAGALFALDWDYAEVGAWCAALATRPPSARAPSATPPRPRLAINMRSAAQLRIPLDPDVVREAERVHD